MLVSLQDPLSPSGGATEMYSQVYLNLTPFLEPAGYEQALSQLDIMVSGVTLLSTPDRTDRLVCRRRRGRRRDYALQLQSD
jgi:hypothetical protein